MRALAGAIALLGALAGALGAQVLRAPVPDRVVVLTFDDAVVSHATHVAPRLKRLGFGATFYATEFVQPPFADKTLYMTWRQIGALGAMGFEIGNHTARHTHVDRMSPAQMTAELREIEVKTVATGAARPTTFAYPAYATHPSALATLADAGYLFARIGGNRAYDPTRDHPLLIPSFSTSGGDTLPVAKALAEAHDGKIVVFTVHGVPDTAHPWVTTEPALFDWLLARLHSGGYTVIALRDVARWVDPVKARTTIVPSF